MAEIPPLKTPGAIVQFEGTDVAVLGGIRNLAGELTFQDTVAAAGAQVTLSQLLAGAGGTAWTDLSDTPATIIANEAVFGNSAGNALEFKGVTFAQIKAHEPAVTGILNPTELQLSTNSTQVIISAGDLGIIIRTTSQNVTEFVSSLGSVAMIFPTNILGHQSFWTASDTGLTATVVIKEYATHPTIADLRQEALLGVSVHEDGVIVGIVNTPDIYKDQGQAVTDLYRPSSVQGLPLVAGTGTAVEIPGTLSIGTTDAILESKGIGFHSSLGISPNFSPTIPGEDPFDFATINGSGDPFDIQITTFPKTWNNAGVETPLTGQKAAVTQVAWLANGSGVAQLGTTAWDNFDTAVGSIQLERIQNPLWDIAREFGAVIGIVVISNQATTLWIDGAAHLFPTAGGQVSVGGVTQYIGLTDTPGSFLERGLVQTINPTNDALVGGKIRAKDEYTFPGNVAPATDIGPRDIVNAARFNIEDVSLAVKTAETVTPLIVDINLAGVTMFPGAKPTLGTGVTESVTVPTTLLAVQGQEFTVDIDSGGTVWQDLTIAIRGWVEPE